jgi:16S rRNA (cytosine967-C5)-methyltransferase
MPTQPDATLAQPLRGPVRALLAGSLRWMLRLAPAADSLLQQGQQYEPRLRCLMIVALHQIEYSQSPAPPVVNIAVDAARALGHPGAAGFVNALLRRYLAQRESILARVDRSDPARVAPRWCCANAQARRRAASMDPGEQRPAYDPAGQLCV